MTEFIDAYTNQKQSYHEIWAALQINHSTVSVNAESLLIYNNMQDSNSPKPAK